MQKIISSSESEKRCRDVLVGDVYGLAKSSNPEEYAEERAFKAEGDFREGLVRVVIELHHKPYSSPQELTKNILKEKVDDLEKMIIALGGRVEGYYAHLVEAWIPLVRLCDLAQREEIRRIRRPDRPIPLGEPFRTR